MEIKQRMLFLTIFVIISAIGIAIVTGDVSHLNFGGQNQQPPVTEICLGCICEAISGCNRTLACSGTVCGLFGITWAYWSDGGKPTQPGESPDSPNAYPNCVNEPYCAAKAVQGYMTKFGQDCNGDGVTNCLDHAALHIHGGFGCRQPLTNAFKVPFDKCLQQIDTLQSYVN